MPKCNSCGDLVELAVKHKGKVLCGECYEELAHGKVQCQNFDIFFGQKEVRRTASEKENS